MAPPIALALYQPDIALNTGAMLRLGACLDVPVHIIHPTGFPFSHAALKRSGLDYLDQVDMVEHTGWDAFEDWRRARGHRLALLTTKAAQSVYDARFASGDILLVGRESAGVPDTVASAAELRLRIPMRQRARALNVATAAALVLGEALRQTNHFETLP